MQRYELLKFDRFLFRIHKRETGNVIDSTKIRFCEKVGNEKASNTNGRLSTLRQAAKRSQHRVEDWPLKEMAQNGCRYVCQHLLTHSGFDQSSMYYLPPIEYSYHVLPTIMNCKYVGSAQSLQLAIHTFTHLPIE